MRKSRVSFEEKLSAVKDYINGIRSVSQISSSCQVNRKTIRRWASKYQLKGELAQNTYYPSELKIQAVEEYLEGKLSMNDICKKYQISTDSILGRWIKRYNGHEMLKSHNSKGDKLMTIGRKTDEMTETEKLAAQVKLLEAENNRLQMENGFLKKLKEVERRLTGKPNI